MDPLSAIPDYTQTDGGEEGRDKGTEPNTSQTTASQPRNTTHQATQEEETSTRTRNTRTRNTETTRNEQARTPQRPSQDERTEAAEQTLIIEMLSVFHLFVENLAIGRSILVFDCCGKAYRANCVPKHRHASSPHTSQTIQTEKALAYGSEGSMARSPKTN